jgi:hypothetical protein
VPGDFGVPAVLGLPVDLIEEVPEVDGPVPGRQLADYLAGGARPVRRLTALVAKSLVSVGACHECAWRHYVGLSRVCSLCGVYFTGLDKMALQMPRRSWPWTGCCGKRRHGWSERGFDQAASMQCHDRKVERMTGIEPA